MAEISFLSKQNKKLRCLFEERKTQLSGHEALEDIFYDPSKLLDDCGLKGVLDDEPFKYIRTAGSVWEFYLLRFVSKIGRRKFNNLIKPISSEQDPINGCRRTKLGNPFDKWHENYPMIKNSHLQKATQSFADKLVSRKCPIRQLKGSNDFDEKRKKAAEAFFRYLIGGESGRKITKVLFEKLKGYDDFQDRLLLLVKTYPQYDLFITSGLMTCLYGGKNVEWVDAKLASAVANALKSKYHRNPMPVVQNVCNIIDSQKNKKYFKPPYKDIYHVRVGHRERVNINFRIQTWLKLLKDTLNASK